jgi:predicted phage terminase large subunit-like protein
MDFPTTVKTIREKHKYWWPYSAILIEDKANGSAVIQMLSQEIAGILPVNPQGGKITRAQSVSPLIEAGNVYLPHPSYMPWVADFLEECASFPNAAHDDQVDAMTQILLRWHQPSGGTYVVPWSDLVNLEGFVDGRVRISPV